MPDKIEMREVALEAGLRQFRRIPRFAGDGRKQLASHLLDLAEVARSLSKTDLAILQAILQYGSIARAAAALGPDRPAYRTYIQRRLRFFQGLWAKFRKNVSRKVGSGG